MLARITGTLEALDDAAAMIGVPGTGMAYEVLLPAYLAHRLSRGGAGGEVTLHTLQYLESQGQGASFTPRLIGFASARERDFFELLTTVKGLGNKRALRAMAIEPAAIARSIAERDHRALQRLPEIGPKLAELVIHELKSKADPFVHLAGAAASSAPSAPPLSLAEPKSTRTPKSARRAEAATDSTPARSGAKSRLAAPEPVLPIRETIDALVTLGEDPIDAERMVARAVDRARAAGGQPPTVPGDLLAAAYAAR